MNLVIIGHNIATSRQKTMVDYFTKNKIKTKIITPCNWGNEKFKKNKNIITTKCIFGNNITRYFLPNLFFYLKKLNPDVVYCQAEPWSIIAFECAIICKFLKIPLILYTYENLTQVYEKRWKKYFGLSKIIENYTLSNTKAIICGNKTAQKIVKKNGFTGKTIVLPITGIDLTKFKKFKNNSKTKFGLENKKVILYLGRIVEEKGIKDIIDSIKFVVKKHKNCVFLFVGDGPDLKYFKEYSKKEGVDEFTKFIKQINYNEVPKIMNASDIFVYPSQKTKNWEEQFGFSIAEALSCELPVITTNTGAIPEFFEENVFLIEEKSPKSIAKNIDLIFKGEKKKYNRNKYSINNIFKQTINFIKEVEHGKN